jgi:hypothetical protein
MYSPISVNTAIRVGPHEYTNLQIVLKITHFVTSTRASLDVHQALCLFAIAACVPGIEETSSMWSRACGSYLVDGARCHTAVNRPHNHVLFSFGTLLHGNFLREMGTLTIGRVSMKSVYLVEWIITSAELIRAVIIDLGQGASMVESRK